MSVWVHEFQPLEDSGKQRGATTATGETPEACGAARPLRDLAGGHLSIGSLALAPATGLLRASSDHVGECILQNGCLFDCMYQQSQRGA